MAINYKILFEVKLLHEYYLTSKDGITIFAGVDQSTRMEFLEDFYIQGMESVTKDILFEFPSHLVEEYDGYHLKLLPTFSGFKVAIMVRQRILADNSLVYEPFAPLPASLNIYVLFTKRNSNIYSYTNARISNPLPAIYLFSNADLTSDQVFPFLTSTISPLRSGYNYEQGELVSFGSGDIRGYFKNNFGEQWNLFAGSNFANENDRLLLPLKFYYTFPASRNITVSNFVLKNKTGDTIKSILFNNTDQKDKILLDLEDIKNLLIVPSTSSLKDYVFTLEVNGSDGYFNVHHILFNEDIYAKSLWGIASINPIVSNTAFNLFSSEGFLRKRRNPSGVWTEAPVFEIPVKSRFAYFRFINDKGKELKLVPELFDYLDKEDKMLLSIKPRSIAQSFFQLKKEGSMDMKYVPNPINYDIKRDSKERLCFDIMVPRSDLFPLVI